MRSLSVAATGMLAQQLNVEVISNNIANMTTTAFKRQRPEFQDLLYQNMRQVGSRSSDSGTVVPNGIQLGSGVKLASVYRIIEQGDLTSTGNILDLAIQGDGWFRIRMPNGEDAYTRAGTFQKSADGEIVTPDGYPVAQGISITDDATSVSINSNGEIEVTVSGQTTPQNLGQFELVTFPNPAGLESIGENLFRETPSSGSATSGLPGQAGYGSLLQGFLETSNVNAVAQITELISAQRAYELNSKVISTSDEMMSTVNQMR